MRSMDLNCDMGESFGPWRMGRDNEIMPWISSANVACGAHAGDPNVMAATVRLAKQHNVAVGAHPGYPDLQGFGRRPFALSGDELVHSLLAQIGALWAIARAEGVELQHVKAHGALYNAAARDAALARSIAAAVRRFSPTLILYCLPNSEMELAGRELGLAVATEGFADRAYEPNGSLADRKLDGALLATPEEAASQAIDLASGRVLARDGTDLHLQIATICVHGDTPRAPEIAQAVNTALTQAGFAVSSPSDARG